jgi:hypothetical protein
MTHSQIDEILMESLSVEELVDQDRYLGDSIHLHDGVWWRRVKPFFYQPAFYLQSIPLGSASPDRLKAVLGYHHRVPDSLPCNSRYGVLINQHVKDYSLEVLPGEERRIIKKFYGQLSVKKVSDVDDLLTDGYQAYVSFRKRTGWGKDKSDYTVFSMWIRKSFELGKRFFLGVYHDETLIAFSNPHAVEGVAGLQVVISHSDYLKFRPNDLLFHALMTMSRNSPQVHTAHGGPESVKPSLDRFKMKYGFEVVRYPFHLWLNPLVEPLLRLFYRKKYDNLVGARANGGNESA